MKALPDLIEAELRRLLAKLPEWRCKMCQEVWCYAEPEGRICLDCQKIVEEDRLRALPKPVALRGSRVPLDFRLDYDWLVAPWPRDALHPDTDTASWHGHPPFVTWAGVNGCGKTTRAVHQLWNLYRAGHRPVFFVTERDLVAEDWGLEPRAHMHRAKRAAGLVFDELGSTADPRRKGQAWDLALALIDHRYARHLPTIVTTHRPPSSQLAAQVGLPGQSLEENAPAVSDRLRDGLIILPPRRSWRGRLTCESQRGERS